MEQSTYLNGISLLIILLSPIVHDSGVSLYVVGNTYVRLMLLVYILYAANVSVFSGILAFLAVFTLLVLRNREVITTFPDIHSNIPVQKQVLYEAQAETASDHVFVAEDDDYAANMKDSNPRVTLGPIGASSAQFFESNKLL